jgi:hypothetical protein
MAKLERKVGPEGRKIFERFLAQVARLQEKQQLELMGVEDDTEGNGSADAGAASADVGSGAPVQGEEASVTLQIF